MDTLQIPPNMKIVAGVNPCGDLTLEFKVHGNVYDYEKGAGEVQDFLDESEARILRDFLDSVLEKYSEKNQENA